jgi:hypothetical protein
VVIELFRMSDLKTFVGFVSMAEEKSGLEFVY